MPSWTVIYYEDEKGNCPIEEFINSRSVANRAKIFSLLSVLEEKGPNLPRPYADLLRDGIHELRLKLSGDQFRILYFFCYKDFIILTNSFKKKTQRVPEKEILKALKCKIDFLKRVTESQLRETYNENI